MSPRTVLLGLLAVAIAFSSAYAFGHATDVPAAADTTPATPIAVSRDLAPLPMPARHEAAPPLARRVRPRRAKRHARVAPESHERRAAPEQPAPPAASGPLRLSPAPQPKPPAPRPERTYDEPDYEPPAPRATPAPAPRPEEEPEEVPEDGTPE